jgi:hypothetical protein
MVLLLGLHFILGAALGAFFRIGIMLAVVALVVVEGLLGWYATMNLPLYVVGIFAFVAVQAGYVCGALIRPATKAEPSAAPPVGNLRSPE